MRPALTACGGVETADALGAGEHDLVAREHALILVEEAREVPSTSLLAAASHSGVGSTRQPPKRW